MLGNAIGIFDSGIGGLTVVQAVLKVAPQQDIVYLGDTARLPYGTKSARTIQRYALEGIQFLLMRKVRLIIVACNTASAYALGSLQDISSVPILGVIEPAVEQAIKITRNGHIGIIGSRATIKSRVYQEIIRKKDAKVKIYAQGCPLFVPLVEEGWIGREETYKIAEYYLRPLVRHKIDTLILGCTHYPLLKRVISSILGRGVSLVNSAECVAAGLGKRMGPAKKGYHPKMQFYVTDDAEHFAHLAQRFLGRPVKIRCITQG